MMVYGGFGGAGEVMRADIKGGRGQGGGLVVVVGEGNRKGRDEGGGFGVGGEEREGEEKG